MGGLWLGALVTLSILAITTAKDAKWKLLNLLIILAFMSAGFAIGLNVGALQTSDQLRHQGWWGSNMEIGGRLAVPLTILLGCVGGLGCWRWNKMRQKKRATPTSGR